MAKKDVMKQLRDVVATINKNLGCKLSYKKLYADVKKIMEKPENEREALFVEQYKKLNKEIFDVVSKKRALANSNSFWNEKYGMAYQSYSIAKATADAKYITKICAGTIDPEYSNKMDISLESSKNIRDWEMAELNSYTSYKTLSYAMSNLTPEVVGYEIDTLRESLGIASDPTNSKSNPDLLVFTNDYTEPKNNVVSLAYTKMKIVEAELAKHGRIWRWIFSGKVKAYTDFINASKDALEKVGFKEEEHGEKALEHAQTKMFAGFGRDTELVKDEYKSAVERYEISQIEEIHDARNQVSKAEELDKNVKSDFISTLDHYAQKYGVEKEAFRDAYVSWGYGAESYDKRRKPDDLKSEALRVFMAGLKGMLSSATANGKEINIPEFMKDAREIAVLAVQHYVPMFGPNGTVKLDAPLYMDKLSADAINNRLGVFLKGKVSEEQMAEYKKQAIDVVNEWRSDLTKVWEEDKKVADTYVAPTPRIFTTEEEMIANSLLTIGYRPPNLNNSLQIEKHEEIFLKVANRWFGSKTEHPDGARNVLLQNAKKISEMKNLVEKRRLNRRDPNVIEEVKKEEEYLQKQWDRFDSYTAEKNPNYVPKTVEDFEIKDNPALANEKKSPATPMRENMPVIMEENEAETEVSKPIEEPAKSVSIESQVK